VHTRQGEYETGERRYRRKKVDGKCALLMSTKHKEAALYEGGFTPRFEAKKIVHRNDLERRECRWRIEEGGRDFLQGNSDQGISKGGKTDKGEDSTNYIFR